MGVQNTPPQVDMLAKYEVTTPNRLAITPWLDGKLDDEEWDILHAEAGGPVYMQWTPNNLYLAGTAQKGKDVIFSLDLSGDGWLIGRDNLEVRLNWVNDAPKISARLLDATSRNAPTWVYLPVIENMAKVFGTADANSWNYELKLQLVDLPQVVLGRTLGIRSDQVSPDASIPQPYVPRTTALVTLRYERGKGMLPGMEWAPEYRYRAVTPGDDITIRLTFKNLGKGGLKRADMRSEGFAKDSTKNLGLPFPRFDTKGRSYIDYDTEVAADARRGYRVLRAEFTGMNDEKVLIQTCYEIADTVTIETSFPRDLVMSPDSRVIKGTVTVVSNSRKRVDGKLMLGLPDTWTASKNREKKFFIYNARGGTKIPVEIIAPQGAQGLVPIAIRVQIGEKVVQQNDYIVIR